MSSSAHGRFLLLLLSSFAAAQTVTVQEGNILLKDLEGTAHGITDSGRDSEPSLSADGRQVVFVRGIREARGIGVPHVIVSELWVAATKQAALPKRVYKEAVKMPGGRSSDAFTTPKFSPD